ncbi:aminotransferase class I/II-fold pyridoxal phosphate-dependent enzyme [Candidatus Peregrinibacteria bacterium]|jgi:aspartate/tyrosine/aromatic aminotransferase|nr:aminotransferase class I/II-fold pyridoxal phosphate-dependent enzyme [Candidatus Peregrinibacteria bacterium]MBT4056381.1 aminotransferase class I/II-fold pyridoxal phosphate-dependent enzyme [Candidatus Peregrinibacteria bacterium]
MTPAQDFFAPYKPVAPNAIQVAQNNFVADPRPTDPALPSGQRKHSLAQGFLLNNKQRDNQDPGQLFEMQSVTEAKRLFFEEDLQNPDLDRYLSPKDPTLLKLEPLVQKTLFGKQNPRIMTAPLPGMAPSFTTIFTLLQQEHPELDTIVLGTNGYGGYLSVLQSSFKNVVKYTHSTEDNKFNLEEFTKTIEALPNPSQTVLLLQADAYNYTGVNPTSEQKKQIIEILKKHKVLTLIDNAYQGLTKGLGEDVEIVRLLAETDLPFIVYDSYSKKSQLYGWRVAFAHFVTGSPDQAKTLRNNLYSLIRNRFLAIPPMFKVIYHLLSNPELHKQWTEQDVPAAREILTNSKKLMAQELGEGFEYIHPDNTQGMFNKFNISHKGGQELAEKFHIYAVNAKDEGRLDAQGQPKESLRVNMGSIPEQDIPYIAAALKEIYSQHQTS